MIAKLIVWAPNRDEAISRMKRALSEYAIGGIKTTIPFHIRALSDPRFKSGDYSTGFVETMNMDKVRQPDEHDIAAAFAAIIKHRETRKKIQQGTDGNENSPSPESAWKLAGRREAVRRESG